MSSNPRQPAPDNATTPVTISASPCAKAQPPAKSAAPQAMISNQSEVLKLRDGRLRFCLYVRSSDLRRSRPPIFCPMLGLGSVRSRLRRISSISRSYLFVIAVLFLELARTLLPV